MAHYGSIFRSLLAAFITAFLGLAIGRSAPFEDAYDARDVALAFPEYQPDARTSIALDRMRRVAESLPASLQRARSFVARALTHDNWSADHFDPGRAAVGGATA